MPGSRVRVPPLLCPGDARAFSLLADRGCGQPIHWSSIVSRNNTAFWGIPYPPRITMVRAGFALIAALLLTASASAQGPGTKFAGLIGGATLSDIDNFGSGFQSLEKDRWGGAAGAMVGFNAGRTATTLEVLWTQKGGGDTRLDYIELPLTVGAILA